MHQRLDLSAACSGYEGGCWHGLFQDATPFSLKNALHFEPCLECLPLYFVHPPIHPPWPLASIRTCQVALFDTWPHAVLKFLALQNAGPLGKPRNHAAYAASLQEPTTPARSRATSSGQRPQLPRDGDAPAAAHSRPPTHSAPSAIPQSARLQQQQSQRQLQGASRPSEVIEEDASATAFPVPQHRLARSAGPAKPGRADSGRSGSGRTRAPL